MGLNSLIDTEISVPGSIANLGPGFDTLAVAVALYLRVRVAAVREDALKDSRRQLRFRFPELQLTGENLIERAFRFLADSKPLDFPSLDVEVSSDIPMRSGLGSSAAAIVAGVKLYQAVAGPLSRQEELDAVCELEGHPDNAAAALLGGLTTGCRLADGSHIAISIPWPEEIAFLVLTPEMHIDTASSRRALPQQIARADAIFNLQRVVLLLQSLRTPGHAFLKEGLRDRLHQPYRQQFVPGLERALALEHPDLLGVCLGGSGPSIVALAQRNLGAVEELLRQSFEPLGIPYRMRVLRAHPAAELPPARKLPRRDSPDQKPEGSDVPARPACEVDVR
jgi:homoserine kinase